MEKGIQNVIDLVIEHQDEINMYGISVTQLQIILETVFQNSYFTYNHHVYQQILGLFMGCKPSPTIAVVRVYYFEKRSIYMDITFITNYDMNKGYER